MKLWLAQILGYLGVKIIDRMMSQDEIIGGAEVPRETIMGDSRWQYFSMNELRCRGKDCCGGEMKMDPEFMQKIVSLRRQLGFPFIVTSAYRCPVHNARVSSTGPNGVHTTGHAIDIAVSGRDALRLLEAALSSHQFTGIGIQQKGSGRFIHLDDAVGEHRPTIFSY